MWSSLPAVENEVKVPSLAPGLEVDITVELIAPSYPGKENHLVFLVLRETLCF